MSEKIYDIEIVKTDNVNLYLDVDRQSYRIRWVDCSKKLTEARQAEREYIEISPSGYGLHWPLIDEDLAVSPLLKQAGKLVVELAYA